MKTAVLRAVSHDLRTPLMAILTSASALARDDLELDARRSRASCAATILGEAGRLDRLVGNLLDLSRLQAGAAQPEPDAAGRRRPRRPGARRARRGGPARRGRRFPRSRPRSRADAQQIQRVLVNLIENALKYSPAAEPVRVQVTHDVGGGAGSRRSTTARESPTARLRADLRAVSARVATATAAAPVSGWRSRAASPRRTAAASGRSRGAGRARRSCSRCPPRRRGTRREQGACARRRRRAADPARAADEPARRRLRGGHGRHGRRCARRGRDASARRGDPRPRPARTAPARRWLASCARGARRR